MKKYLIGLIIMFVFGVTLPISTNAQTCNLTRKSSKAKRVNYSNANYYQQNRNQRRASSQQNRNQRRPSFWKRNRNLKNIAIGTGAGAIIGGLIGGNRKGIGVGALAGAGSGALYTYVLKPKKKRVYRRY